MTALGPSKDAGSAGGGGSGAGLCTLKAAASSGIPTSSQVPRYRRPLTGRSSDPRRGRRREERGGSAAMPWL